MSESFGAELRQQRERQQIALTVIAEQTKIKLSLLEGLERDDVSHWPSGIFRRAFIRTYAHAIGLEPDAVVHQFLTLYPDASDECAPVPAVPPEADGVSANHGPPTRLRYLVGSAIDSLGRRRRDAVVPPRPAQAEPERTDPPPVAAERSGTDTPPVAAERSGTESLLVAAQNRPAAHRPRRRSRSSRSDGARVYRARPAADPRGAAPLLQEMAGGLGRQG